MSKSPGAQEDCKIKVTKNGPYIVSGRIPLTAMKIECDQSGTPGKWSFGKIFNVSENYALCRCGQSNNKPFCDGTHNEVDFDGTETSDNESFERMATVIDSPELKLKDAEMLCASARFCHRGGDIWEVIHRSDDPEDRKSVIANASDCPSGRLVILDKRSPSAAAPLPPAAVTVLTRCSCSGCAQPICPPSRRWWWRRPT